MAPPSTLFRFRIKTDLLPAVLDIRVAQHPSETRIFLITRVIAYVLNYEAGIEFGAGLAEPDAPAIRVLGGHGEITKWIDVGNPSAKRLHKSAKAAPVVRVYTYKDVERLKKEAVGEKIYNAHKIKVFALDSDFLESLSEDLLRDNQWELSLIGEDLEIAAQGEVYLGSVIEHSLS